MTHKILKSNLPADFAEEVEKFTAEMDFWAERERVVAEENKKPLGPRPVWGDFAGERDPAGKFSAEITKWENEKLKRHAPVKKPIASPDVAASVQLVGGKHVADFEVVNDDPTPDQVLRGKKNALLNAIYHAEQMAIDAILPPVGKRRLINKKIADIRIADNIRMDGIAKQLKDANTKFLGAVNNQNEHPEDEKLAVMTETLKIAAKNLADKLSDPNSVHVIERPIADTQIINEETSRNQKCNAIALVAMHALSNVEDLTADNIDSFNLPTFD